MLEIGRFFSPFEPKKFPKKTASVFIALLVVYSLARGIVGAAFRPFWFDELLTLAIAGQPSLQQMRAAIARGFDTQVPLFYLVERVSLLLPFSKEVALRL